MIYQCQSCGYISKKWLGKCPDCNNWNTFSEEQNIDIKKNKSNKIQAVAIPLPEIELKKIIRISTGFNEFNRALGGGLVTGQVILIGGSPGIGKSTLLTQILNNLTQNNIKGIYLTAEESAYQVKLRTERLNINNPNFLIISENNLTNAILEVKKNKPEFLIVDSIQTIYSENSSSIPGSISQIKECASVLIDYAKSNNICLFIVGHITKEGQIAGPKVLEHMVDTVLYFESESTTSFRIIRTLKNRFGNVNEIAIFEMTSFGLKEVVDPTNIFLEHREKENIGSVIFPLVEGSRIFLIEVQALVSNSTFSMPRRHAQGIDPNRMNLLITVMEKILGVNLFSNDIFINIPGGIKVNDPAVDLAVVVAILSSFLNKTIDTSCACFGEVGLNGEVRKSSFHKERIKEAARMGFKEIITPKNNEKDEKFEKTKILSINNINFLADFFS